jgi:hypothetical protein
MCGCVYRSTGPSCLTMTATLSPNMSLTALSRSPSLSHTHSLSPPARPPCPPLFPFLSLSLSLSLSLALKHLPSPSQYTHRYTRNTHTSLSHTPPLSLSLSLSLSPKVGHRTTGCRANWTIFFFIHKHTLGSVIRPLEAVPMYVCIYTY